MLQDVFKASDLSGLPPEFIQRLWASRLANNKDVVYILSKVANAAGLTHESQLSHKQQFELDRIFELLDAARKYAPEFLETSEIPPNVYHILAARPFLETEDDAVFDAVPHLTLHWMREVKFMEDDPNEYIGDYSPARFCQLLFEWQETKEFKDKLLDGTYLFDADQREISNYVSRVNIPLPSSHSELTELEMAIAYEIQDVGFLLNHFDHQNEDMFWHVPYVSKTPAEELTAERLFEHSGWHGLPQIRDTFGFSFEYCLKKSSGDPRKATHLFAQKFLNPAQQYLNTVENPVLSGVALSMLYAAMEYDKDLRNQLFDLATDNLKCLIGLAFPDVTDKEKITPTPDALAQIKQVRFVHMLTNLFYSQSYLSSKNVPVIYIREHLLKLHDDICLAETVPAPNSRLSFYRKSVIELARQRYAGISADFPALELPPLSARSQSGISPSHDHN